MKILQIAPRLPYPLTDGGAIGIFNITKHLAMRGHEVTMVCFGAPGLEIPSELKRWASVRIVGGQTGHSVKKVLQSYRHRVPYTIEKFQSGLMMSTLMELCEAQRFDAVHTDHLVMAPYAIALKNAYGLPILLREHNYETTMLERFADNEQNVLLKLFVRSEYFRMQTYEPAICRRFDCCAMITPDDQRRLAAAAPDAISVCIPAGVSMPEQTEEGAEDQNSILFLSSLDWKPNADGFMWFYKEVFPIIQSRVPCAHIVIVGKGNAPELRAIHNEHVKFVGFVEDVAPYLRRATVCIVPLFTGSGIRIKILEMMSYGKAIVTTPIGCEGITLTDGESALIASERDGFADAVARALVDADARLRLGRRARDTAQQSYAWESVAAQFEAAYRSMLNSRQN
jgi:polysaccharide biosynthesis protein PslH